MMSVEPEESLTLDVDARTRAAAVLRNVLEDPDTRRHRCKEWEEDGECRICWEITRDVLLAAENLRSCSTCNGGGLVAPGSCCPECGGLGLEMIEGGGRGTA